jgi:hypothetical protein
MISFSFGSQAAFVNRSAKHFSVTPIAIGRCSLRAGD